MGLTIKTLYRFECDHCGKGAPQADNATDAHKDAEDEGFKISEWMHGECQAAIAKAESV